MNLDATTSARGRAAESPVAELYAALTELVLKKNPDSLSIRRGLWGPDTKTLREGMERANRTLVQGCRLGPGRHVLDAGCGLGGTAIWLAEEYGVRVTGLTNCEPHVGVAARCAEERGVGQLVRFLHGDFMDLPFPDASFDAVLNQESFCYADNKLAYLRGVYRVLKPGGRWQALDAELLSGAPVSEKQRALVAAVRENWRLPPYVSWLDVVAMLKEAGFAGIEERDLTAEALPWSDRNHRNFSLFSLLNPQFRETNPVFQEFLDGGALFARGMSEGLFTYRFYAGMRPAQ